MKKRQRHAFPSKFCAQRSHGKGGGAGLQRRFICRGQRVPEEGFVAAEGLRPRKLPVAYNGLAVWRDSKYSECATSA